MEIRTVRAHRVRGFVPTVAMLLPLAGIVAACSDAAAPMPTALAPSSANPGKNVSGSNQRILFTSDRDRDLGDFEVYSVKPDGTDPKRLTNAPGTDQFAVWSPDGKRIAFRSDRDNPHGEIYVMNADGTEVVRLTNAPAFNNEPSWSKDGRRIVFMSTRDGVDPTKGAAGDNEIYTMNADGSDVVRLTNNAAFDGSPTFSPDGRFIAFLSDRDHPGLTAELYLMRVDGTGVTRLTSQNGDVSYPSWDPHGRRLTFGIFESDGSSGIFTLNLDNSGLTQLTFGRNLDAFPSWSTDGSQIVFTSKRDGQAQLYVMNADGTELTRLMVNDTIDQFPRWSR